ncbi:hypothetical protein PR202_ga12043 [Eleusine coracana subsp. coracana]|uniref:Uncharacterized protein n=1 Tax=Eleusine coracana subsp. coracana TaxID=191504 RepID=A0AAV5CAL2_ELECO|nr:hypothetical protein PR202_ga12043 [Eleusine coracana subsp. coracana]
MPPAASPSASICESPACVATSAWIRPRLPHSSPTLVASGRLLAYSSASVCELPMSSGRRRRLRRPLRLDQASPVAFVARGHRVRPPTASACDSPSLFGSARSLLPAAFPLPPPPPSASRRCRWTLQRASPSAASSVG